MPVSRSDFGRYYRELIETRHFVESQAYYRHSMERFWQAFDRIQKLGLPRGTSTIDIGGGIMAVLLARILGFDASVGDVQHSGEDDVRALGVSFQEVDLLSDTLLPGTQYELVVLQEVIEHLPDPPYVVFGRIMRFIKPGGTLFLTTPNGSRMRNILYMLAGRRVLDNFRRAEPGESLGHQQEYVLPQMTWQVQRAGMELLFGEEYDDGWQGSTFLARISHLGLKPINLVPHLRNGLMVAARRPTAPH